MSSYTIRIPVDIYNNMLEENESISEIVRAACELFISRNADVGYTIPVKKTKRKAAPVRIEYESMKVYIKYYESHSMSRPEFFDTSLLFWLANKDDATVMQKIVSSNEKFKKDILVAISNIYEILLENDINNEKLLVIKSILNTYEIR